MLSANDHYQQKKASAAEAAASITDHSNLILGMGVAMPPAFLAALSERVRGGGGLSRLNLYYMHAGTAATNTIMAADLMSVLKLYARRDG